MTELASCPFCGAEPYLRQWSDAARVECHNRDCFGPITSAYGTCEQAIAAWNRRATPADVSGLVERPDQPEISVERYVLGLFAEEAGEVLQWVGKSLRFGFDTPGRLDSGTGLVTGETPRQLIPPEVGDFFAAVEFAAAHDMIDMAAVEAAKDRKLAKLLNPAARDNLGRPLAPQPAAEALSRSQPSPARGVDAVRVKALEWSDSEAKAIVGIYRIHDVSGFLGDPRYDLWLAKSEEDEGHFVDGSFGSWDETSAAAQADYEQRILSSLEPAPARADAGT